MLNVIYEDNHILVVIKPQNVPTQEDSSGDKDMLTLVKEYIKEKYDKPGNVYVGLVHRLDRPTGGVMVFAKTSKAAARLTEAIKSNEITKTYLTIVNGVPKVKKQKLVNYLKKNEKTNIVSVVGPAVSGAKYAELNYETLSSLNGTSLLSVNLITGRSHQIRAQLSHMGNHIYNDFKYGSKTKGNLMLWAYKLVLLHPTTKQKMTFTVFPELVGAWKTYENTLANLK
ncbi:MAG: RluA family pseudouridine synthase [Clostridia bacterium]|nr:RluA family pseudouridine synthase [Clostridia bacterium]